ncbi:MAG: hypothetical protein HZA54_08155 [Planctomycetes bacterium]|nr:hypothetical protein [Planctomycetota bacterium]
MRPATLLWLLFALATTPILPAAAQSSRDLEQRITELEKQLTDVKSELRAQRALEDAELKARVDDYLKHARPVAAPLEELRRRVRLGGYLTAVYHNLGDLAQQAPFDRNFNAFTLRRMVLDIDAEITEQLEVGIELETEQNVVDSWLHNRNAIEIDEVEIEHADLRWKLCRPLNLRIGQLLVPFGAYNLDPEDPEHELPDRPLVDSFVIPTAWGEAGLGLFGVVWESDGVELAYDLAVVNGLNERVHEQDAELERHGVRKGRGDIGADNNSDKAVAGRLCLRREEAFEIGLSGYTGVWRDRGSERINGAAFDARWEVTDALTVKGEAAYLAIGEPSTRYLAQLYASKEAAGAAAAALPAGTWGFYAEAVYRFFPEFLKDTFLGKDLEKPTLEAIARLDYMTVDDVFPSTTGSWTDVSAGRVEDADQYRLTLGLGYRPSEHAIFTLGYMWNAGDIQFQDGDGVFLGTSVGF